jgi:hypothetical protein
LIEEKKDNKQTGKEKQEIKKEGSLLMPWV